jgi:hypothetical protein
MANSTNGNQIPVEAIGYRAGLSGKQAALANALPDDKCVCGYPWRDHDPRKGDSLIAGSHCRMFRKRIADA